MRNRTVSQLRAFANQLRALVQLDGVELLMVVVCLGFLSLQIYSLTAPMIGAHDWRQIDTYAVAYNFFHESANFFVPRLDTLNGRSGITAMEAPLLQYTTYLLMHLLGDSPQVGRLTVWLFCIAGTALGTLMIRRHSNRRLAVAYLLMVALAPAGLFQFRQLLPDPVYVTLSFGAAYLFDRSTYTSHHRLFAVGIAVYTAAALVKIPALTLGPAMWAFSIQGRDLTTRQRALRSTAFLIPIALSAAWFQWAEFIKNAYSGADYMTIRVSLRGLTEMSSHPGKMEHLFGYLLPGYDINWALAPAVLVGLVVAWRPRYRRLCVPFAIWLASTFIFFGAYHGRIQSHWYNTTMAVPPLAYFGAVGLHHAWRGWLWYWRGRERVPATALIMLLAFCFTWAVGGTEVTGEMVTGARGRHTWLSVGALRLFVACVAGGLALAKIEGVRARRAVSIALLAGAVATGVRATRDQVYTFQFHTAQGRWEAFEAKRARIRAAFDRYSTRDDLIVTDRRTPVLLHLANRKGWTLARPQPLDLFKFRGARFFFHSKKVKRLNPDVRGLEPLVAGPDWELYCIDRNGCPPLEGS